jgi:hypothetical protein
MTEQGDDDPQLRALRAVWLALPDEDPPTRGLDALMAAARVKADEMVAVPWWRRVLDVLRKPPVLALASVMVLIGGAVLISQRTDVAEAPARERVEQKPESPPAAPAPQTVAPPEKETAAPQPEPPPNPHSGAEPADLAPVRPSIPHHEGVKHVAKPPPAGVTSPAFTPTEPKVPATKPKLDLQPGRGDEGVTKAGETEDAATRGPRQVLVDDLLVQSRSAADRGDCENARLIAKRIQNQDLAFYRSRVATDTAIQKCIATASTTLSE